MHHPADRAPFRLMMQKMASTFHVELTEMRLATYWEALDDLPIEAVTWAGGQAIRDEERFPVPAVVRQYAQRYREAKLRQAEHAAEKLLPQWSDTPDEVGLAAIHDVLQMLGDHMTIPMHPVYQQPSEETPEERKTRLIEQALKLGALSPTPHVHGDSRNA